MTQIAATIVLLYFLARECLSAYLARAAGTAWIIFSGALALSLLIPIWAVWS